MATIVNARDILLQAAGTRLLAVQLPSSYSTTGDHLGTWNTLSQTVHRNNQITFSATGALLNAGGGALTTLNSVTGNYLGNFSGLSQLVHRNDQISITSGGSLLGAGGGQITNLDYGNVGGTKPPASATENFFSRSSGNPSGGSDGDAHWNTSTQTMWFKTGGVWAVGGTVNANEITVGTLAAARIASNSVTTDKLNVGAVSDITTNLGTFTSGTLGGSSNVTVSGVARFNGFTSSGLGTASIVCNDFGNTSFGVVAFGGSAGVTAQSTGGAGIQGRTNGSGAGVRAITSSSGPALDVIGRSVLGSVSMSTQTISNLTAGAANFVSGSNVSGTVASAVNCSNATNATNASNANSLGGTSASGWCRGIATNSGTATASSFGFGLSVTGSLGATVRTRASGNNIFIENISDERFKTDVKNEVYGLEFINKLRPVTYKWKDGSTDRTYHNFIAQEVEQQLTIDSDGLVDKNLDGTLGVGSMDSILVKAIQELSEKVRKLENEKS